MRKLLPNEMPVKMIGNNAGDGSHAAKGRDLDRWVELGCVLILGQEFGDLEDVIDAFLLRHPTWRVLWEPADNAGRKTPILYDNAKLKRVVWHAVVTVIAGLLWGPRGAGPDRSQEKHLSIGRFKIRGNGAVFVVLNNHLVASAFSTRGAEAERRQESWWAQASAFFRKVNAVTRVPIFGGGDWNARPRNTLLNKAIRLIVNGTWIWDSEGPTHEDSWIDLYGHKFHLNIRVLDTGIEETDGSLNHNDHRAPWVEYGMMPRR